MEVLKLTYDVDTNFDIQGQYPIIIDSTEYAKVNIKSNFNNISMSFFTQFSKIWKDNLFGVFSGQFNMDGTTIKTIFDIKGKIDNTVYKGVPLGTVKWTGNYRDKTLTFDQFTSDWVDNHISGSAILPIVYDLAEIEKTWHSDGELLVRTEGSFSSAVFLSTFLAETDSIVGDICLLYTSPSPRD